MNRAQRRELEAGLAPEYRGRAGHRRMIDETPLRVSVSGIRGKTYTARLAAGLLTERGHSVYAKLTGTTPVSLKDGVSHPIERDGRKTVLDETLWETKKHWPFDALVLENQGITPYTMRTFNRHYCRPHHLLLTNIRRDHQGDIARRLPMMAREFVRSAGRGTTVVSGEQDPKLRRTMEREASRLHLRFLHAETRRDVPGAEAVAALDVLLEDALGTGIAPGRRRALEDELAQAFRWQPSALPAVRWFNGGEINDVDSTSAVLDHLQSRERLPVTYVAYFRRDRPDRTTSFVPFLRDLLGDPTTRRVVLAGHRSATIARRLERYGPVTHAADTTDGAESVLDRIDRDCRGEAVMTIVNAVPPWPNHLVERLDTGARRVKPGSQRPGAALDVRLRHRPAEALA